MRLLPFITLRTTQRKVIRPRSDASVQHRSHQAERWKKSSMKTEWAFPAGLGDGAVLDLEISPRGGADTGSLAAQKVRDGLDAGLFRAKEGWG